MFIEVVNEDSKKHPYGDPDIEVAKVALRTFIKHHHDEVQATIQIAEYEFKVWRIDEITKYEYETFSYKTFKASAWSVPSEGVKPACTTTYEFRTFVDEDAFVASTSPLNTGILTLHGDDGGHSADYWRPIEGRKVIDELVSLIEQKDVIPQLIALVYDLTPDKRSEQIQEIQAAIERAQIWVNRAELQEKMHGHYM